MRMHLFCYGTLMFPEVWSVVVQGQYTATTGTIDGYERRAVKAETYPCVIVSTTAERLQGLVYMDVDTADIRRLDLFEGAYYRRVTVPCVLETGNRIEVALYRFRTAYRHLVSDQPWDMEQFKKTGMAQFLAHYSGFQIP
jgi:gamma-glutamylcyclotransferase (GGCT)/AIG2-like uncharacterized protein YtfP